MANQAAKNASAFCLVTPAASRLDRLGQAPRSVSGERGMYQHRVPSYKCPGVPYDFRMCSALLLLCGVGLVVGWLGVFGFGRVAAWVGVGSPPYQQCFSLLSGFGAGCVLRPHGREGVCGRVSCRSDSCGFATWRSRVGHACQSPSDGCAQDECEFRLGGFSPVRSRWRVPLFLEGLLGCF